MRILKTSLLLVLVWCSHLHAQTIDFVLDIDGFLVFHRVSQFVQTGELITVDGQFMEDGLTEQYRQAQYLRQFLQFLSDTPGARVSFYSKGIAKRNFELLRQIYLPDGRTALQLATGDDGQVRVFSAQDKKSLWALAFKPDLQRAFLIDDVVDNVDAAERANYITVINRSKGMQFYPENKDIEALEQEIINDPVSDQLRNKTVLEHKLAQIELPRIALLIHRTLLASKPDRSDLLENLAAIQWKMPLSPQLDLDNYVGLLRPNAFNVDDIAEGVELLKSHGARALRQIGPAIVGLKGRAHGDATNCAGFLVNQGA